MKQDRDIQMDIIRGIGIILIVLAHTKSPFNNFVYLFHLALFFILSGYFFKSDDMKDLKSLKEFIVKKFKRLYIPYIIVNVIFILLNNIFLKNNIYSDDTHYYFLPIDVLKQIINLILYSNVTEMGGATWFLPLLFSITIVYASIELLVKKSVKEVNIVQFFIAIYFFEIGLYFIDNKIRIPFFKQQFFTCYILFDIGRKFKCLKLKELNGKINLILLTVSFIMLIKLNNIGIIEISLNIYTNLLFFMCTSVFGWIFIYELAYYIKKINKVNEVFAYVGRNTLPIVILHFMMFKIINLMGVIIAKEDITLISAFPTLFGGDCWWTIYTVFGILMPILLNEVKNKLVQFSTK